MLFNSLEFFIFFIVVYTIYLFLDHKWQNRMLLLASYIFYGAWDVRFLSLIIFSTVLDYFCGLKIDQSKDAAGKKLFLVMSIVGNLSVLGLFKYYNFFISNIRSLFALFGFETGLLTAQIILPLGISFYTFQSMSYTIDIYNGKIKPTRRFLDFALFVAYFPQLIAGPIERARHLLPQILTRRPFKQDWLYEGMYLIFFGAYLKIFVADNLAKIVDPVFAASQVDGSAVIVGTYAFAFQIFSDFAGYSMIARGVSKLMGFDLVINFNLPYFSVNPREFWSRWHISLSTWLRDYVYIPLGGNRDGNYKTLRNLTLTMLLGGLWHGASWTFVIWGAYHGLLLVLHRMYKAVFPSGKMAISSKAQKLANLLKMFILFHLICFGWLIFRATTLMQVGEMIQAAITSRQFFNIELAGRLLFIVTPMILIQILQYIKNDLLVILKLKPIIQISIYLMMLFSIMLYGVTSNEEFIYFQF